MSDSVQPYELQPARLLCPWDSPGKNTGVGCYALLQGDLPTQGSNPCLLHCRQTLYHWATREAPGNNLLNYNKNYSMKDNRIRDFTMHSLQYGVRNLKTTDGLSWWLSGKESAGQCRRHGFDPWSRKILHVAEQLSPCPTTIEPVLKSSWTTTPETMCHNYWCPSTLEPLIHSQRSHCSEKPKDHN